MGSCQSLSHNSPIPDGIYQALFHFDSRAASLLLKDLSKAGLGCRAMEIFDWLRALDVSHPLRPPLRRLHLHSHDLPLHL